VVGNQVGKDHKRPRKHWMDCVEEDWHRAVISRCNITTDR